MSIKSPPVCVLGMTHDTLSALRDDFLAPAEAERLRAHIASCEACQERLVDLDTLAHELRGQRVPSPDHRLWDAVARAVRHLTPQRRYLPMVRAPKPSKEVWGALGAAAAVLLVVVAFARVLSRPTTSVPTNPLSWHEVTLPADFTAKGAYTSIGAGAGRADGLRLCAHAGSELAGLVDLGDARRWGTLAAQHEVPHSRRRDPHLRRAPRRIRSQCRHRELLWPAGGVSPGNQVRQEHVTFDGGATWSDLGAGLAFTRLATRQGLTYAVMLDQGAKDTAPHLVVSSDHFQSSKPEDDVIVAAGQYVTNLWRDSASNAVLAQTNEGALWESAHGNQGIHRSCAHPTQAHSLRWRRRAVAS